MAPYQCPLCHQPLISHGPYWRCEAQHQFDCAKEGYVNLLPVQFKRSKIPGDNQDMIQARRAFLDAGYYRPLRDRTVGLIAELCNQGQGDWLDIGCGEGYYTSALAAAISSGVHGLDISKTAVRSAAKRYANVQFCVASSQRLPFTNASLGGILRIYAPCNPDEMRRTVKAGGVLVTVAPGPRHLMELKAQVYEHVIPHPLKEESFEGFTPLHRESLGYQMNLTGSAAAALLQMTPFAWRAGADLMARLQAMPHFPCETDFIIRAWRREQTDL